MECSCPMLVTSFFCLGTSIQLMGYLDSDWFESMETVPSIEPSTWVPIERMRRRWIRRLLGLLVVVLLVVRLLLLLHLLLEMWVPIRVLILLGRRSTAHLGRWQARMIHARVHSGRWHARIARKHRKFSLRRMQPSLSLMRRWVILVQRRGLLVLSLLL